MRLRVVAVAAIVFAGGLSGCALLSDRRAFAKKAESGAAPVVREYRDYVAKDPALNDNEKKMRNMLADELQNLLKEGGK